MTDSRSAQDSRFPGVFDYDDHVPADLLARWTSLNPDRTVLLDLAGFLATAGALLVAGIGLVGLATGGLAGGVGVVMCLVGLLVAAVTTITRRRWKRRNHLRGSDIDLVLAHRQEIRFEDWNQLIDGRQRFDSWPKRHNSPTAQPGRSARSRPRRCGRTPTPTCSTTACGSICRRAPDGSRWPPGTCTCCASSWVHDRGAPNPVG